MLNVQPGLPVLTYSDRPEVSETLVDTLEKMTFDGGLLRMEFVVNRLDHPVPGQGPQGKKVTAARISISLPGLVALVTNLTGMLAALQQQGVIQQAPPPGGPSQTLN